MDREKEERLITVTIRIAKLDQKAVIVIATKNPVKQSRFS